MRVKFGLILTMSTVLLLSGCVQSKQEFTLNPNGSGKLSVEATFTRTSFGTPGGHIDPENELRKAVSEILERSTGIAAWKDIEFKINEDNRMWFQGTAYFNSLSKLNLHNLSIIKPSLRSNNAGELVLDIAMAKQPSTEAVPVALSESALARKVKVERFRYESAKPLMHSILSTAKTEAVFHLPGMVAEAINFERPEEDKLRIVFDGTKMIEALNTETKDNGWWRDQINAGRNIPTDGPPFDDKLNETLFGTKGPVRATITGELRPLFDYETEVVAAREEYPELLKELNILTSIPVAKGGGFRSLNVGGVRIVQSADATRGITPFYSSASYTLSLIGELPDAVLHVADGTVETAIADTGESLLPSDESRRKIQTNRCRLSRDNAAVIFEVDLSMPSEKVEYLKEVSGTLVYHISAGAEPFDLGIESFETGTNGNKFGAVVSSVTREEHESEISVTLNLPRAWLESVTFYNTDGEELAVSKHGGRSSASSVTRDYLFKGLFPKTGRIIAEVHSDVKKHEIPFKITNVSVAGRPLENTEPSQ